MAADMEKDTVKNTAKDTQKGMSKDMPENTVQTAQQQAQSGEQRADGLQNLLQFDLEGMVAYCATLGEKRFRAQQLFRWIHRQGVADFDRMTNLAKQLRSRLHSHATVQPLRVLSEHVSADGTVKWLFDVGGGDAVETVYIPERTRGTLCISSQAGCAVGCRFCSTGHQGFSRNLTTAEILAQLWFAEHTLRERQGRTQESERVISNVVMMGMGEPLQNYRQLLPALRVMLDDHGYGLSRRKVTVSTSGVVPMMERLAQDCPVALAVSLHAPQDALRDDLVPLNRKYPLEQLMAACRAYLPHAPRDFLTFEYCMLRGVNDSLEHARQLVKLVRRQDVPCKFNLIPFNPFSGSGLHVSAPGDVAAFAGVLQNAGLVTTVRKTRGDDIAAACGQLAGDVQDRTQVRERMERRRVIPIHTEAEKEKEDGVDAVRAADTGS